jgi:hypothetical protein
VVSFPDGVYCEPLRKNHCRAGFNTGISVVDDWLARCALQNQDKHLSVTQVLVSPEGVLAGFYTIATGQVDFGALPPTVAKGLPKGALPVAVLAWRLYLSAKTGRGFGRSCAAEKPTRLID